MSDYNFKTRTFSVESQIDDLVENREYESAKALYFLAARSGSSSACQFLAVAMDPLATVYPTEMQDLFSPNRRKANRYYNRQLKCLRREAKEGTYPSMFNLYNMHNSCHRLLSMKHRIDIAEQWLRRAASSGKDLPQQELKYFMQNRSKH